MSVVPETLQASVAQPVNIGIQPAATPRSRARLAIEFAVCVFCGLVLAWPFRSYDGSLPGFITLAPVLWIAVNQRKALHTALCAAGFALTWTTFCFSFLWPMTIGGAIALSIYTSLFYVLGLLLIRRVARGGGTLAVIGTASIWALIEIARSVVPVLYFPWLLLGHTLLYNDHLRQGADLFGVYGLSFLVVCVNAALAFGVPELLKKQPFSADLALTPHQRRHRAWRALCFAFALLLGDFCYGEARIVNLQPRLIAGPPIGFIQGNIVNKLGRSDEEREQQLERHIELHRQLLQKCKAEGQMPVMVCWAETMLPDGINSDPLRRFQDLVAETGVPAMTGYNYDDPKGTPTHRILYNSVFFFNRQGQQVFRVAKRRLIAFGEYIPFASLFPCLLYFQPVTRDQYTPGTECSPIGQAGIYHFGVNICIEDVHPDLARECANSGADTLLNFTNDGFFYGTYGPRSHFQAAAWRSIEIRRPMLRVTNTGITAAIDPLGNVSIPIPPATEGVGTATLLGIADDQNEFAQPTTLVMRLGESGLAALFFSLLLGCFLLARPRAK